ncbi:hypothetical protein [Thalassococcus lentus]|uniref:Uncharacterized protein n=1 Tax=Thalassococcus lentus TaxID=1210524 RepID=A0ABT4XQP6_9RHOB|nr:hypothetical protein [Thalassococcus lentus]MDA7424263.1 hypothetical protein [Thalassococcus lentus]
MRNLQTLAGLLIMTLSANPVAAQTLSCLFTTECLDTEGCQETSYEVTFGAMEDRFLMSGIAGERAFDLLSEEEGHRAFASGASNGAVGLMTLLSDGAATYTEVGLFEGSYAVRYHGSCTQ